jgi:hypothetical protein
MSTDFESQLRRQLHRAAEGAPRFTGLRPESPGDGGEPERPRRRLAAVLVGAVAAAVIAGVVVANVVGGERELDGEASCAAAADFRGVGYVGAGELLRTPRPGSVLGQATVPACDDGNGSAGPRDVTVWEVPGVSPGTAVMAADRLYIAEDVTAWPPALEALRRAVACTDAVTSVSGAWTSAEGPMPTEDGRLEPPYVAVVAADGGAGLPLARYSSVSLPIEITERTTGAGDRNLVRRGLQAGEAVTVDVHCEGDDFVADRIGLSTR